MVERDRIAHVHSEVVRRLARENNAGPGGSQLALDGGRAPYLTFEVDNLEQDVQLSTAAAYPAAQRKRRLGDS